jgi:hypothetical protein
MRTPRRRPAKTQRWTRSVPQQGRAPSVPSPNEHADSPAATASRRATEGDDSWLLYRVVFFIIATVLAVGVVAGLALLVALTGAI